MFVLLHVYFDFLQIILFHLTSACCVEIDLKIAVGYFSSDKQVTDVELVKIVGGLERS